MNELEPLKNKFSEFLKTVRTFLKACAQQLISKMLGGRSFSDEKLLRRDGSGKIVYGERSLSMNARMILAVVAVCLAVGFFVGFMATKAGSAGGTLPAGATRGHFPWVESFFGKKISFPGTQPDGSFIFSSFELPEDVRSWNLMAAAMTLSTHFAWQGTGSGKVTFFEGKDLAAFSVDDLGRKRDRPSDWSHFDSFQFYAFQPGHQSESLVFMVTDIWGKRYEEPINVPHRLWAKFLISVHKMTDAIDVQKINQFSISRRGAGQAIDFYFDDIRLIPSSGAAAVRLGTEKMMDYSFSTRKTQWEAMDPQLNGPVVHIPFVVKNETNAFCHLCPVEGGMPFPAGELQDLNIVRLRNAFGEDLPFQTRVLAYWPDRSVKWLGLNFESTLQSQEGAGYFLDYGPNVRRMDFASPLKVMQEDDRIRISTGPMEAVLNQTAFYLFDRISVDQNGNGFFESEEQMTSQAKLTLTAWGKEFRTDLDKKTYKIEIEEEGPQRAVVKASGWYQAEDGQRYCQAIVRYYFYQGKSHVKVSHTLIYTGYPANKQYGAYKMIQLLENETIEAYGVRVPYSFSQTGGERVFAGLTQKEPMAMIAGNSLEFFQKDYDSAGLDRDGESISPEDTYAGWLDISNETKGLTMALRHFRENFPKAFRIDRPRGEVSIDLWPKAAGPLDLSTTPNAVGPDAHGRGNAFGLAKTHELMFYFHKGDAAQSKALHAGTSFMEPLIFRTNPYWIDATGALGRLYPVNQKYATEEKILERLFNWAERHPRQFKWYGMIDFGDTLTWWRQEGKGESAEEDEHYDEPGWHPVGRWGWYNNEGVGTHTGALLQFARSGEWRYFEFGENLARHIMDIDTVHYDTVTHDKRLHNKISERYSKVGAMHRHNGNHWGDRTDEASHTNVTGILLYYYLTGNERALEVAKEVGSYFLTEPFSYMERADMAPNRAMSNALWGDVLLYQQTWDDRYKKAADKIVKIFLKGQQPDGSFLENYNPVLGTWSGPKHELYMSGYLVGALISYHELTQDEQVKDMFLKLVRYLAPTEFSGPVILHGIAYAYLITRDPFFIAMAEGNLKQILMNQQLSSDPMMDGLIYAKPIYHRPMAFLSTMPYVFGAIEEHYQEKAEPTEMKP